MDSQIVRLESLESEPLQGVNKPKTSTQLKAEPKTNRSVVERSRQGWTQRVEQAISQAHPMLRLGDTAVFNFRVKKLERLVVVHELNLLPVKPLETRTLVQIVCQLVQLEYGFQVYGVVFVKQGSLPRDAEGKKHRHLCRQKFISGELAVVDDWCEGPQYRRSFQVLKRDLETLLAQMTATKANADSG